MTAQDPFNLARFVEAQEHVYDTALAEIRSGLKRSHWMWFIFPQFKGLGSSAMAQRFAIGSASEARAFLAHPVLGGRLVECADALMGLEDTSALEVFGYPDDLKLCSSVTLFAWISPAGSLFERVLDKYFAGQRDEKTLALLRVS